MVSVSTWNPAPAAIVSVCSPGLGKVVWNTRRRVATHRKLPDFPRELDGALHMVWEGFIGPRLDQTRPSG